MLMQGRWWRAEYSFTEPPSDLRALVAEMRSQCNRDAESEASEIRSIGRSVTHWADKLEAVLQEQSDD